MNRNRNRMTKASLRGSLGRVLTACVVSGCLSLDVSVALANTVIVQDSFYYSGEIVNVENRTPDTVNLPGSNWVSLVQWNWSHPNIAGNGASWASPTNVVKMNEELCTINLSLAGYNTGKLRISADIALPDHLSGEGVALGFKASVPYTGYASADYNTVIKVDFTGLSVNSAGQIALLVNGAVQATRESNLELVAGQFYPLSYDIDTATGDISKIKFNGADIADFATTAFTSAATAHATYLVRGGSRGYIDNFTVTSVEVVVEGPAVNNASGASDIAGTSATLNGVLTSGSSADIYVCWGTDPESWSNTNLLTAVPEGMFSTTVTGLSLSTTYHYRCFASNAGGTAWADGTSSFVSAAQIFNWTGSGGNANWNNAANWDPGTGFPNLARETAILTNFSSLVYLNQSAVTVGGITMMPLDSWDDGLTIEGTAPGQTLVFDYNDGPAFIKIIGERWANCTISAPIVLGNNVEVSTTTAQNRWSLILRGPVTGSGKLIAKSGRIGLDPLEDTSYATGFSGTRSGGYLWKRGTKTATLTGTNDVALAGDWAGYAAVSGGGKLAIDGGIFTNQSASERGLLFGDAGNALVVTNGAKLINARSGNGAFFNSAGNDVIVTGEGSLWDLHGDSVSINANSNRLTIADGGHVMNTLGKIGWCDWQNQIGGSYNAVLVTGNSSLWNVGGAMSVGRNALSNTLTIADGAVVENTWLWLGGYAYYEEGASSDNGLIIANGGELNSGRDDGWGWGSCIGVGGVSGGRVDRNYALVTGAGSTWDLIDRPLRIGYVTTAGATGVCNRVRVEAGGALTNVNTLYIGSTANGGASSSNDLTVAAGGAVAASAVIVGEAASSGNTLTLAGGTLSAGTLTLDIGNTLAPVIGADGIAAMTVSGTATFSAGSTIRPGAAAGVAPKGTYTVLTAGSIVDNGLTLDPAVDKRWSFTVSGNTLTVAFKSSGTVLTLY